MLNTPIAGIQKAIQSKTIFDAELHEIGQRLAKIYIIVGLRTQHFPSKEIDLFIIQFIKNNYPTRKLDELVVAFEMAVKGELDLEDVKVYDQFTIEYLCRIMNAYSSWIVRYNNDKQVKYQEPEVKQLTDQEKMEEINEWIEKEHINYNFLPLYLFDWMTYFKMIDYSEQDKIELYNRAIILRSKELENKALTGDRSDRLYYTRFGEMKRTHFANITKEEEIAIDNIFKKISVIETIKKEKQ
jgi:hypothetical protein